MLRTGNSKLYILAALAFITVLGVSSAMAQADTYQVSYYSNAHTAGAPDGKVRIDNPGVDNGADLCAEIYVFDNTEEMLECCGCKETSNDLRTFSINTNLTNNPGNGITPTTGVIKIVSATVNSRGNCDPTGGWSLTNHTGAIVPTPDLRAWATHIQNKGVGGSYPATAEEFQDSTLVPWELAYLQRQCFQVRQLGSGRGVCSCGSGL
jgi:hypothetical protein